MIFDKIKKLFYKQKSIYAIQLYKDVVGNCSKSNRCVGYFSSFEKAKKAIIDNIEIVTDDGYYKYAVIEKVYEGLYGISSNKDSYEQWWFSLIKKVKQIDKPKHFDGIVGLTIG